MMFELCNKEFSLEKYKYHCDGIVGHNGRCSTRVFEVVLFDDGEIVVDGRKVGE